MFKKQSLKLCTCALAVSTLMAWVSVQAQTKPVSSPVVQQGGSGSITIEQQWEYIVVSFGKTLFGSPQKTLAYRSIGLLAGQEAPELENSLDILGRFGWEMVTIVGSIGGDQQVVLKRKYNRNLVNNEYSAILKGKELYIKDLIDIMEREQRLREEFARSLEAEKNKPRLIDLDAAEEKAKRDDRDNAIVNAYQDAFSKTELASMSTVKVNSNFGGSRVSLVATSDLTSKFLINGNTYRRSEIKSYIEGQMNKYRFVHEALDKYGDVDLTVDAVIQFGGKAVTVYTYKVTWSQILKSWR